MVLPVTLMSTGGLDMNSIAGDASARHTVPVIDRMMEVLGELETRTAGSASARSPRR